MTQQDLLDAVKDIDGASESIKNMYEELEMRGDVIRELIREKAYFTSLVRKMREVQKATRGNLNKEPIACIKLEIEQTSHEFDVDAYIKTMEL